MVRKPTNLSDKHVKVPKDYHDDDVLRDAANPPGGAPASEAERRPAAGQGSSQSGLPAWVLIPVGHDDRRFVVFNPSNHRVGDTPYFEALNDHKGLVWGDGAKGARAFIQLLLDRDISRFKPRKLPTVVGTIKLEQKIQSANTVAKWIMGVLREGGLHVAEEVDGGAGTTRVWLELSAQPITTDALYREYRAYTGGERPEVMEMFAKKLREILGDTIDATRPSSNYRPTPRAHFAAASRGRPPCYRFKALAEARAAFADYIHEDIQW